MITSASSLSAAHAAHLQELAETLDRAARLHAELRDLGWKSSVAVRALDQFAAAVIVADSDGRVIELNRAAERITVAGRRVDDPGREAARAARLRSRAAREPYRRQRLADIATRSDVQITTLRTQLRSVMRRVNVQRQTDLVRVLARIPGHCRGLTVIRQRSRASPRPRRSARSLRRSCSARAVGYPSFALPA